MKFFLYFIYVIYIFFFKYYIFLIIKIIKINNFHGKKILYYFEKLNFIYKSNEFYGLNI